MDRREFVKVMTATGVVAAVAPGCALRYEAAEPRGVAGKPPGRDETLLIHGVNLVDVEQGRLFPEKTLLVRGDRIERRLLDGFEDEPVADRRFDAGGRYLIPGLINAHCHVTLPGVLAPSLSLLCSAGEQIDRNCVDCILHGVTTVRDQLGHRDAILDRRERIARGELMGPRILRSCAVEIPGGYLDISDLIFSGGVALVRNPAEAADAVARAADDGADQIKLALQEVSILRSVFNDCEPIPPMPDEMLAATAAEADRRGFYAALHHVSLDGFRTGLNLEVPSFEHMVADQPLTDDDIVRFLELDAAVVPTISVPWAFCFPQDSDENFDHPHVQRMFDHKREHIGGMIEEFTIPTVTRIAGRTFEKYLTPRYFDRLRMWPTPSARHFNTACIHMMENAVRMYEAGCRVGCGNDGGVPLLWPGAMQLEMKILEMNGVPPAEILRSATAVNASIIGMEGSLGVIEPGAVADLVLLDADPLLSTDALAPVSAVFQGGRLVHEKDPPADSGQPAAAHQRVLSSRG